MSDRSYLPPDITNVHVMSWCPFCYLGWSREQGQLFGNSPFPACLINLPTFTVQAHIPAIRFDQEADTGMTLIANMFKPKPYEIKRFVTAGIDPRTMRKPVPGLAEALASAKCDTCEAFRRVTGDPASRCAVHLRPSEMAKVAA